MVPSKRHVECKCGENDKHDKRYNLLNYFELHQREGSSVSFKSDSIGGHLETILEESNSPRKEDNKDEWRGVAEKTDILQFEVAIPGESHKHIGYQK
jgi:hypothetical protein